jgi:hypothetical protein
MMHTMHMTKKGMSVPLHGVFFGCKAAARFTFDVLRGNLFLSLPFLAASVVDFSVSFVGSFVGASTPFSLKIITIFAAFPASRP